jgi:spore germination cell wall hydrolase CwlJ-like protein
MLDIDCLSKAIYFEARGESQLGKLAVGHVVVNRAKNKSLCTVIYDGCQFSWTCKAQKSPFGPAWLESKKIASDIISGKTTDPSFGATSFHNTSVRPGWAARLKFTVRIDSHIFYKK